MKILLAIQFVLAAIISVCVFSILNQQVTDVKNLCYSNCESSYVLRTQDADGKFRTIPIDSVKVIRGRNEYQRSCDLYLDTEKSTFCLSSGYVEIIQGEQK